ncbi:hypothetical protein KW799_02150, partial [Candidatus Parcubacteria bacterium]|nr:hypothetical protein [Candidatus Parcubacteria bacterium]
VAYASNASIVWTISNLASGATCTVSKTSAGGTAFASVTGITASGSASTGSLTQGSYTYQIQCVNGATTLVTKTVSFTVLPQPAGFSITGPSSLRIQFLAQTGADSESGTYFVDNGGTSFANPVTVSVTGVSPSLPASTTITYSFNGGAFSASPSPVIISSPYSSGFTFKYHLNRSIGTATQYTVTLTGTGSGAPDATKQILIVPSGLSPTFEEI